jgi:hypothetical protein
VVSRVVQRAKDINERRDMPWAIERLCLVEAEPREGALVRHVEIAVQLGAKGGDKNDPRASDAVFPLLRQRSKHLVLIEVLGADWPAGAREVFERHKEG